MSPDDLKDETGKILVTGGNGFIGSHVARRLYELGRDVRIVDIAPKSSFTTPIATEVLVGNLCDPVFCRIAVQGVSRVLHFAAVMGGMGTIHAANDMPIYQQNHFMTTNLLAASRDAGVQHFFFASTACVYPDHLQSTADGTISLRESDVWAHPPPSPQGLYGLEKLASEQLLRLGAGSMAVRIARFHNVYGPRGAWNNGHEKAPAAILRKTVAAKLSERTKIELWGSGDQKRSFLWIEDCVDAVIRLICSNSTEPLNVGSDRSVSVKDLASIAVRAVGLNPDGLSYIYRADMPVGVAARNSNNEAVTSALGWAPTTTLEEGMKKTASWIEGEIRTLLASVGEAERPKVLDELTKSRKVDIRIESTKSFGILLPITSRGLPDPGDCLKKLQVFADSLVETTWRDTHTVSGDFRLHIYVAIDHDDEYLLRESKAEAILRGAGLTDITRVVCKHPRGHVCALWRDCAKRAWEDGCEWMTLMGDDVELLDEGWMSRVRKEFEFISNTEGVPTGFGCVAFSDVSFPGMPTFPVVHRTHLDIFDGEVVPSAFINQDGDPYLYQMYRRWGASSMIPCRIQNSVGGSVDARYEKHHAVGWTFDVLEEGTRGIESWLAQKEVKVERRLTLDVIVPCYRVNIGILDRILELKPSNTCSTMFIIIIDDPHSPNIIELLAKYGARPDVRIRVNVRNLGASESRNRGMRESSAEWVHFLDDDVEPDSALLKNAERYIRQHPDAAGFIGATLFPCAETVATAAIYLASVTYFWDIAKKMKDHRDLPWGVTANLIARRNIQDDIYYDPVFPKTGGGEDIDFCLKKRRARMDHGGGGFLAAPDVIVTHPWWNGGGRSYQRFWKWAQGDGALVRMYPEYTYRDFAPNSGECLLVCVIALVLATGFGLVTVNWRVAWLAVKMILSLMAANLLHDLYWHLCWEAERLQALDTTVTGFRWLLALLESTLIRMSSETGRVVGLLQRGEHWYMGRRFDWFVGRVGDGPKHNERTNSVQKFGLWILIFVAACI
ncbi:hypothetical protein FRB94_010532 [Tulasnella sp. JGI-2019a]|nr:hypothetical protein FRB94_010532 [Tulasnella sp. JGI-2019a]KAG9017916.1 hypothetical protein FRB93_004727 [Tulasnella sp. JGI-2019a]